MTHNAWALEVGFNIVCKHCQLVGIFLEIRTIFVQEGLKDIFQMHPD